MNIVPVTDWYYLHNAAKGKPARFSRVAFWRIDTTAEGAMQVIGIINESTNGKAVLTAANATGGVFVHRDDMHTAHVPMLAELRNRITPDPTARPAARGVVRLVRASPPDNSAQ